MLTLSRPNIPSTALPAMGDVLDSGMLVYGKQGLAFEAALKDFLGAKHVFLVSSGTAALHLSYLALGLERDDWVIVPDFTFPATSSAAHFANLRPFAVDVDPTTYTLDPDALEAALDNWSEDRRPRAIMVVHEFGAAAKMTHIREIARRHDLTVLEDAACAIGALDDNGLIGADSLAASFSFHPRKTLTTGEGGAIATNDDAMAQRIDRLRNHGIVRGPNGVDFPEAGLNYRLTDFQAALGLAQLPELSGWIETRRALARVYAEALAPLAKAGRITLPKALPGHSWQTHMIVLADGIDRAQVIAAMAERGYQCGLGAQSVTDLGLVKHHGPITVGPRLYHQGLALPFCESYTVEELRGCAEALCGVLGA